MKALYGKETLHHVHNSLSYIIIQQSYSIDGPEFIESQVQPTEVGGVVHKQPGQGITELIPELQSVVVEQEGRAGRGRDVEVYSGRGVICCQLIFYYQLRPERGGGQ